jgi:hypothetical protein
MGTARAAAGYRVTPRRFRRCLAVFLAFACYVCYVPSIFPEDSAIKSYRRRFLTAGISAKADILLEAAADGDAAGSMGPLYESALLFALDGAELLHDSPEMLRIVAAAARGAGSAGSKDSLDTLWKVFTSYPDSRSRVEVLNSLGRLGKGNSAVVENLNRYLDSQNKLRRSGVEGDYPAVLACIEALAGAGDSSSFPVLFDVITAGYPEAAGREAAVALDAIPGNYKQFLLDRILKDPPSVKFAAFTASAGSTRLGPGERGQLAEAALEQSLGYFPGSAGENALLAGMGYAAARVIAGLRWNRGSAQAIRHYYRVQTDFQQGGAPKERFLEAIVCLGAVGTPDAALALGLQLGLLNARTESAGVYDEDIVLALVRALGSIGDKSAFDHLLYIGYLPYGGHIQAAAKEALNRLKW